MSVTKKERALVQFGVITDIQYADIEDRVAWYDASKTRRYRYALQQVKQAFRVWKETTDDETDVRTTFALQLG